MEFGEEKPWSVAYTTVDQDRMPTERIDEDVDPGMLVDVPEVLERQPKTRWAELDEMMDDAYDAYEADRIVAAVYWFVIADLRGVRSFVSEIMTCVDKWNALGCPTDEDSIGPTFTREQYDFGWAALMWFSQSTPEQGVDWMWMASYNGDRNARMFSFKFFGPGMFRSRETWSTLIAHGMKPSTIIAFFVISVVLFSVMAGVAVYVITYHPHLLFR